MMETAVVPARPRLRSAVQNVVAPEVVKEVITLTNDPRTSVAQMSSVLLKDPLLMRSILMKANSTFYGFSRRVSTLDFAIVLLGFDVLRETVSGMLISTALRKMVNVFFRYEEFWNHSLATGIMARCLAEQSGQCPAGEAFAAGLLHDIGILFLDQRLGDGGEGKAQDVAALERLSGVPHGDTGAWIAEQWHLPSSVAECIRHHHHPERAGKAKVLAATVRLADLLALRSEAGRFAADTGGEPDDALLAAAGVSRDMIGEEAIRLYWQSVQKRTAGLQSFSGVVNAVKGQIVEAMAALSNQHRVILALRYYEGLAAGEIAQVLGVPVSVVEERHRAALLALGDVIFNAAEEARERP